MISDVVSGAVDTLDTISNTEKRLRIPIRSRVFSVESFDRVVDTQIKELIPPKPIVKIITITETVAGREEDEVIAEDAAEIAAETALSYTDWLEEQGFTRDTYDDAVDADDSFEDDIRDTYEDYLVLDVGMDSAAAQVFGGDPFEG